MKKFLALISLVVPLLLCAQGLRVPDNDRILKQILDPSSPRYYPALMMRYENSDRTLSADDYHYLYYGFAYQENYRPLEPMPAADNMLMILDMAPEPDSTQCMKLIEYGRRAVGEDPFNPAVLNMLAYAYTILGDTVRARDNAIKVERIIETIKASGTGLEERSPWAILAFSHADAVLGSMGLDAKKRRVVSRTVEFIDTGVRNPATGYFFDFGRAYWVKPEKTDKPEKRGWEINGIKVKR